LKLSCPRRLSNYSSRSSRISFSIACARGFSLTRSGYLSGKDIVSLPDKAAIVDALVEKELKDVFYDRPANWFEYVKAMVNISAPTATEAQQFAEIKATRDVLVHGQGVANAYYVDKAGASARAGSGQPLDVPEPYHQASWELIYKLVRDIGTEMAPKA
jgi:hypothetical protein